MKEIPFTDKVTDRTPANDLDGDTSDDDEDDSDVRHTLTPVTFDRTGLSGKKQSNCNKFTDNYTIKFF